MLVQIKKSFLFSIRSIFSYRTVVLSFLFLNIISVNAKAATIAAESDQSMISDMGIITNIYF